MTSTSPSTHHHHYHHHHHHHQNNNNNNDNNDNNNEHHHPELESLLDTLDTPQPRPYDPHPAPETEDSGIWFFDEGDVYRNEFGAEEMNSVAVNREINETDDKESEFSLNIFRPEKLNVTSSNVKEALQITPTPTNAVLQFVNDQMNQNEWKTLHLLKHVTFRGGDEAVHAYSLTLLKLMRKTFLYQKKKKKNNRINSSTIYQIYQEVLSYFSQFRISIASSSSSFSPSPSNTIRMNCFTAAIHICSWFCFMLIEYESSLPDHVMSSVEVYLALKEVFGAEGNPHAMMVKMLGNLLSQRFRRVSYPWRSSLFQTLTRKIFSDPKHQKGIDLQHPAHFLNYIRVCQKCSKLTEAYIENLELPECIADMTEFIDNTPQENVWALFMSKKKLDHIMNKFHDNQSKYLQAYQSSQINHQSNRTAVDKTVVDKAKLVHYALDELAEAYDEYDVHRIREEQAIKERKEKEKRAKEKERRAEAMGLDYNEDEEEHDEPMAE